MNAQSLTPLQVAQAAISETGFVLIALTDFEQMPAEYNSFSQGYSGIASYASYQKGRSHKYLTLVEGFGIYTSRFETDEELNVRLQARRARWVAEGKIAA